MSAAVIFDGLTLILFSLQGPGRSSKAKLLATVIDHITTLKNQLEQYVRVCVVCVLCVLCQSSLSLVSVLQANVPLFPSYLSRDIASPRFAMCADSLWSSLVRTSFVDLVSEDE